MPCMPPGLLQYPEAQRNYHPEYPIDWSSTRSITLSSSLLKWQSQLILHRVGTTILQQTKYQFARPGRQAPELILLLRKAVSTAKAWSIPIHIAKIDVSKAFDSVSKVSLAEAVCQKLGRAWPSEARLWVDLLENRELSVQVQGREYHVPQTNGVRQGAPDSPVIFRHGYRRYPEQDAGCPTQSIAMLGDDLDDLAYKLGGFKLGSSYSPVIPLLQGGGSS